MDSTGFRYTMYIDTKTGSTCERSEGEIWRGEYDPKTLCGDVKTQRINKILHVQKDIIGTQTPKK